ncbi:hypothetical protein [Streptomyces sp. NPDC050856]|uniref:hypothetical protein n=1 Tax=Streptomyces sp. NPDC050856 TaxID=3154939 RepID=UPI0033DF9561
MERRSVLVGVGALAVPTAVWAAPAPRLSAGYIAAARQLFAAGDYARRALPLLLDAAAAQHRTRLGRAARAAGVWVLASQLVVKQGRTEAAGAYGARAGAAVIRSGNAVVLTAAAREAATPLRGTGRTDEALHLLHEALAHLTAGLP